MGFSATANTLAGGAEFGLGHPQEDDLHAPE